ncbi:MAG: ester cyclase [Chloroflexi bacterium]|nr:MAG: ester cyclase [Chloroflexota bacterium]
MMQGRDVVSLSEANKALVLRHFEEIFNRQDLAVCDEIMADEFVEHGVAPFAEAEPGNVNGPRAMRSTAEWLLAQFPDLHFTVEEIVAEGNTVAVRLLGEGTNLGPIGPLPPTGRRFSARSSHWFRVANGKLAEHWATRDDLTAMVQLGIVHRPSRQPS